MPRVPLRYLVTFSSEDPRHRAENLLGASGDGCRKWLSAPGDKSGRLEAVFQLEKPCSVSNLDIGTYNTFAVQVSVGLSGWPAGHEYCPLIPSTTLMSPTECRTGKNKNGLKMFNKEHFCAEAVGKKWDRLKVVCTQPFRKDVQHGMSILSVKTDDLDSPSGTQSIPVTCSKNSDNESELQNSGDIQKHFFGKELNGAAGKRLTDLQNSLSLIGASTEGGSAEETRYSRTTKLVLAAAGVAGTPKYRPPSNHGNSPDQSPQTASKLRLPFDKEVGIFLDGVDVTEFDLESFTFADLRHRFEKQKMRKLSKDERKVFFRMSQDHVQDVFNARDSGRPPKPLTKPCTPNTSIVQVSKKHMLMERMQNVLTKKNTPSKPGAMKAGPARSDLNPQTLSSVSSSLTKPEKPCKSMVSPDSKSILASSETQSNCVTGHCSDGLTPKLKSVPETVLGDKEESRSEMLSSAAAVVLPNSDRTESTAIESVIAQNPIVPSVDSSLSAGTVDNGTIAGNENSGSKVCISACDTPTTAKRKARSQKSSAKCTQKSTKPQKRKRKSDASSDSSQITARKGHKKCINLHVISYDSSSDEDSNDPPPKRAAVTRTAGTAGPQSGGRGDQDCRNGEVAMSTISMGGGEFSAGLQVTSTPSSRRTGYTTSHTQAADVSMIPDDDYDVRQNFVLCPLCNCLYAKQSIETHAARCRLEVSDSYVDAAVIAGIQEVDSLTAGQGECPICGASFPQHLLADHADTCANLQESMKGSEQW